MKKIPILVVEDDADLAESLFDCLQLEGWDPTVASTGREGLTEFERRDYEVVVTDFRLPEMGGMELLQSLRGISPGTPVILMTAHGTTGLAIEATQKGAFDYLIKPFKSRELLESVERALQTSRMSCRKVSLGKVSEDQGNRDVMIGQSSEMKEVYRGIGNVANKNVTVLIQGKTGTGKELVARAIFQHSDRADKPFIAVNCTAIPENLLESELFGHEKGSFTGAAARRIGRFEQAHGGTLFLDEIGDMTPETQVKMLRVLQEKLIRRVGGDEELSVDVRVIAATHQNLEQAVADGRFREDLYYRINTAIIEVPPLRERQNDIDLLMQHFFDLYCEEFGAEAPKLGQGVVEMLHSYAWPGNVRELENVARKLIIKSNGFPLSEKEVSVLLQQGSAVDTDSGEEENQGGSLSSLVREILLQAQRGELNKPHQKLIDDLEREIVLQALDLSKGNQTEASRLVGISRVTFREKMDKFGLLPRKDPPSDQSSD